MNATAMTTSLTLLCMVLLVAPAAAQAPGGSGGGGSGSSAVGSASSAGAASTSLSSGGTTASAAGQGGGGAMGPDSLYGLIPVDEPPTLSLDQVFNEVARSNPDLRMAQEQLRQQEIGIKQAWSSLLPQISAGGSYTYGFPEQTMDFFDPEQSAQQALLYRSQADMVERSAVAIPDPTEQQAALAQAAALRDVADQMENAEGEPIVVSPAHQFGANLQVVVPLFNGRAIPLIQSAYDVADLTEISSQQARAALLFSAARLYYGAVSAQKLVEIAEGSVASAQQHLDSVQQRVELGELTPLTLQRAELDLVQAQQQLRVARSSMAQARGTLGNLMDRDEEFAIAAPPPVPAVEAEGAVEILIERALSARPELAARQTSLRLAERQQLDAWMRFAPSLSLVAQGNYTSNTSGFMSEPYSGTVSVQASIPIFDGGSRFAKLEEAESKIREASIDLSQTERSIRRQVRGNVADIEVKREALEASRRSLELSQASLASTVKVFELGEATSLDVIDARLVAFNSEVDLSRAELDLEQARLGLAYMLGEFHPASKV